MGNPENRNGTIHTSVLEQGFHARTAREFSLRNVIGIAAVLGAIGSLAIGPHIGDSLSPQQTAGPSAAEAHVTPIHNPSRRHKPKHVKPKKDCTSIRTSPNYIYMGRACISRGDTYNKIDDVDGSGNSDTDKGWTYSVIKLSVKGNDIYKCGFVQDGFLPSAPPRSRAVTHCKNYYRSLVKKGDVFFGNYNCGPIKNGFDPCNDGTFFSPIKRNCPDKKTYENFESDEPSPLNVYGTGQGGFRGVETENKKTSVHYRTRYGVPTSKGTKAMVVRAPKWAFGNNKCVAQKHRSGGPLEKPAV